VFPAISSIPTHWRIGGAAFLALATASAETQVFATSPPEFKLLEASDSAPAFQEVLSSINPWGLACHPDTGLLYFSDPNAGIIGAIDPGAPTPTIITIVDRPTGALHGISLDAVNNRLFFLDSADDSINVVDLQTLAVTPLVLANGIVRPNDLVYDPDQNQLYVTDSGADEVRIVSDTGVIGPSASLPSTEGAWGIALQPGTGDVYFSSFDNGTIHQLLDTTPLTTTEIVSGLAGPRGLEFDRHGNLFCLESGMNRVVVIDVGAGTFAPTGFASALNGRAFLLFDSEDKDGDFLLDDWELRYAKSLVSPNPLSPPSIFDLQWSGASFGNTATATGQIRLDNSLLLNPGSNSLTVLPFVQDFEITITGASSGNGSFNLSDFSEIVFNTGLAPLDLTQELVGQPTDLDPWGTSQPGATGGDFNLFSSSGAPNGTYYFELTANGGDQMLLTSFAPAPDPPLFDPLTTNTDSDHDERSALEELLFNTDPSSSTDPHPFQLERNGPSNYALSFEGPSTGYFFDILLSSDLIHWQPPANPLTDDFLADPLYSTWTLDIDPVAEGLNPGQIFFKVAGGVMPSSP
jgi:sugar lactone lactonase YvrE